MGGNKFWSSMAQRCKLFLSQRKYTGIGLGPRSVSERENTLMRQEFVLEELVQDPSLTSFFFEWQGQLRFSQLVVGRGGYPSVSLCVWVFVCHHLRWPKPKWPLQWSWSKAMCVLLAVSAELIFFEHPERSGFVLTRGRGMNNVPFVGNQCVLKLSGLILSQRARRLCCQLLQLSHFFTSPQ